MDFKSIILFFILIIVFWSCSNKEENIIDNGISDKIEKSKFKYQLNKTASRIEIEEYLDWVNKEKKNDRLSLIIYSNKSMCGGYLRGYFHNKKLVYLMGMNGGELGSGETE